MNSWFLLALCLTCALQVSALHRYFGSKSAYPTSSTPTQQNYNFTALFLLSRHGSRFPTKKHLQRYADLQLIPGLRNWTHTFELHDEGLLSNEGKQEMYALGKLTRDLYANLFTHKYHPRVYELRASKIARTLQSANAFALGLFGHEEPFAIESESLGSDLLLRFHENCHQYQANKKSNTPKMFKVLDPVLDKLKQRFDLKLNHKQLEALWSACVFQGVHQATSACRYFDVKDAEILEFANDVSDYWEKGFGNELNYSMACRLIEHMLDSLEAGKLRFLFGHAENIMPLMAALGFFRDDSFTYQAESEPRNLRKWRSSQVAPFGANLFVALYVEAGETLVQVRHNGNVMDLAHLCKGKPQCAWQEFRMNVAQRIGQCDFEHMCKA